MFYEWIILQLDAYPQVEDMTDVVFLVHWQQIANNGNGLTAQIYGAQQVKLNPNDTFIPYDQLTQSQVVGWVKSALGEEALLKQREYLNQQIKDQISPPVVSPPLPWGDNLTPQQDVQIVSIPDPDPVYPDPDPVYPAPVDNYPDDYVPIDFVLLDP